MNRVHPKSLLHSKWTKRKIQNKEKHFVVTQVEFDEEQNVTLCIVQAVINHNEYSIDWRTLKTPEQWRCGWQ